MVLPGNSQELRVSLKTRNLCHCLTSLTNLPYKTFHSLFSQLSDGNIQGYHDAYKPRMDEMHAFNMVGRPGALSPRKSRNVWHFTVG